MNIRDFIYAEIKEYVGAKNISDELKLSDDLGFDSLDLTELTMQIEDEFNFPETPGDTFAHLKTVGDLIKTYETMLMNQERRNVAIAKYTNMPTLHYTKNGRPYCKITEKPCTKIPQAMCIMNPLKSITTNCNIAKNVYKILVETQQKTK